MRVYAGLCSLLLAACTAGGDDRQDTFGGSDGPAPCTPGEQQACACPGGGPQGAQICNDAGNAFGECFGCAESSSEGSTFGDDGLESSAGDVDEGASTAVDGESDGGASSSGDPNDGIPDNPPQAVPPAPPPDGFPVVQQVAAEFPDLLIGSCVEQGGSNEFLYEVVRRLRMQDDRWGLNWKRGVIGDLSQDVVDYHYGEGVSEESTDVYIIDMIGGHCPENGSQPQPAWNDVTQETLEGGTVGMWTLNGQDL